MKSPRPRKFPKISVIIPAYNEEKLIAKTIKAVLDANYPEKEIIVVDDGSTDNTFKIAKRFEKYGVKVFRKKNGGKASALNFGIEKCSSEFIMALDADSFPAKDCFKKMIGHFKDPRVMAVVPTLKVWKPKTIVERLQSLEYVIASFLKKILALMHSLSMVPGAPMIRKSFFEKHGGYDENNLTEDFEMGLRIQANNYDISHALDAYVYTVVPSTFKSLMRQRVRWDYGTLWNLRKYRSLMGWNHGDLGFFLLPAMAISLGLTSFLVLYLLSMTVWNTIHSLLMLSLINFDIKYMLFDIQLTRIIDHFLDEKFFLTFASFLSGLIIYLIAKRELGEKLKLEYLPYVFVYGLILGFFRIIATVHFCLGKKPKW